MPQMHVRLFVEEFNRPEDETWGQPCSHILKDIADPVPDGLYANKPQYLPLNNPVICAIVEAMGIDAVKFEKLLADWTPDEAVIGMRTDNPEGFINLPSSHPFITGTQGVKSEFGAVILSKGDVLFDFSRDDFTVTITGNLLFHVSKEYPNGFFLTDAMTDATARAVEKGTPLRELVQLDALKTMSPTVDRIDIKSDGLYEIHMMPLPPEGQN